MQRKYITQHSKCIILLKYQLLSNGNLPNCLINLYCSDNLINLEELKVNYPNLKVE